MGDELDGFGGIFDTLMRNWPHSFAAERVQVAMSRSRGHHELSILEHIASLGTHDSKGGVEDCCRQAAHGQSQCQGGDMVAHGHSCSKGKGQDVDVLNSELQTSRVSTYEWPCAP